jgi:hypothetical protein
MSLIDPSGIWSQDDTEAWLTTFALPEDFSWPDNHKTERPVLPSNRLHKGYGFWLRTTPYFPGLFEEIHRIMALAPSDFEVTPTWLAEELNKRRPQGEQQKLF